MKFFTRGELKGLSLILGFIFVLSFFNFRLSLRRARDAERRAGLGAISQALDKFYDDFGFFPPATSDGKILACPKENYGELAKKAVTEEGFVLSVYFEALRACDWGADGLRDLEDDEYPAYLTTFPQDPRSEKSINFVYFSNTRRYQIYASLEGGIEEDGYNEGIVARNLSCGDKICNYGKVYGLTPLDRSIEEYEAELAEKEKIRIMREEGIMD